MPGCSTSGSATTPIAGWKPLRSGYLGIGRQLAHWCRLRGISSARHLQDMPSGELRAKCGVVGLRLQQELRGHACLPLTWHRHRQETCVSRSSAGPSPARRSCTRPSPPMWCAPPAVRKQRQRAAALTIYTRTSPFAPGFYSQAASTQLDLPSNDTAVLLQAARPLVERIFRPHRPLAKAGVRVQHLQSHDILQTHLMVPMVKAARRECLMQTIDRINRRYGRGTLQWAGCGLQPSWLMRRGQLSRAATTRLRDLPVVRA